MFVKQRKEIKRQKRYYEESSFNRLFDESI